MFVSKKGDKMVCKTQLAFNSKRYPTKVNHVRVPAYEIWRHMVIRCGYLGKKLNPNYVDVSISDSWLDYSNFYEDVVLMKGYRVQGFVLDKDILSGESKIYSKDTCCFVPEEVNVALTTSKETRGTHPIGVDFHTKTNKFRARHRGHLGLFDTEYEAFMVYKDSKEAYLKALALKWKDQIDPRVYEALINYTVKITD